MRQEEFMYYGGKVHILDMRQYPVIIFLTKLGDKIVVAV